MGRIRKNYSSAFKAKVALEAIKKEKTMSSCSLRARFYNAKQNHENSNCYRQLD